MVTTRAMRLDHEAAVESSKAVVLTIGFDARDAKSQAQQPDRSAVMDIVMAQSQGSDKPLVQ